MSKTSNRSITELALSSVAKAIETASEAQKKKRTTKTAEEQTRKTREKLSNLIIKGMKAETEYNIRAASAGAGARARQSEGLMAQMQKGIESPYKPDSASELYVDLIERSLAAHREAQRQLPEEEIV